MKKVLLTVGGVICAFFSTQAQITIEQSDFPTAGNEILTGRDTLVSSSISVGSGGANQTWDFSALQVYVLDTLDFADPTTVVNGDSFPSAFLAVSQFGGYGFVEQNGNDVDIIGFSGSFMGFGTDLVAKFDDPQKIIAIPANYQDAFVDTSTLDMTISNNPPIFEIPIPGVTIDSIRIKRTAITDSEIDGWGTVKGHTGTYNCLRQANQEYSEDSIWLYLPNPSILGQGWIFPSFPGTFDNPRITDQVRYNFITKELGYNYVSVVTDDQGTILNATFETVQDSCCAGVGIGEYVKDDNVKVFPNPAVNEITVNTNMFEPTSFELYDLTGKVVLSTTINGNARISIDGIDRGIYLYRIATQEGALLRSGKLSFTE